MANKYASVACYQWYLGISDRYHKQEQVRNILNKKIHAFWNVDNGIG